MRPAPSQRYFGSGATKTQAAVNATTAKEFQINQRLRLPEASERIPVTGTNSTIAKPA